MDFKEIGTPIVFGGETSRIGELFIDVSPPFLRVEMEWGVL